MGFELECDECKARFDEDDKDGRMEHIKEKHPEIFQKLLEDVLDDYWSDVMTKTCPECGYEKMTLIVLENLWFCFKCGQEEKVGKK